jgi:hypothetical protein
MCNKERSMIGYIIITAVLLLLAILAVAQNKKGEEDDKKVGENLNNLLTAIEDIRREE